jgi:hypothetical protein
VICSKSFGGIHRARAWFRIDLSGAGLFGHAHNDGQDQLDLGANSDAARGH